MKCWEKNEISESSDCLYKWVTESLTHPIYTKNAESFSNTTVMFGETSGSVVTFF